MTGGMAGLAGLDPLIVDWCVKHLGSPPVEQFFGVQRLSTVHGLRLADGREVVLKVRGALERQRACTVVHEAMWQAGIPCPRPLAGPAPLAVGAAAVLVVGGEDEEAVDARTLAVNAETWEGEGFAAVGDLGADGYGRLLARMVGAAPAVDDLTTLDPPVPWLHWDHGDPGRTWPPPASDRWDPHRIDHEIDPLIHEVARRARARLLAPDVAALPRVAAHGDFEAQNCRWVPDEDGQPRLVIHDWDSVVAMPEAVLAGNSAFQYNSVLDCAITTLEQNDAFMAAYAAERGRGWTDAGVAGGVRDRRLGGRLQRCVRAPQGWPRPGDGGIAGAGRGEAAARGGVTGDVASAVIRESSVPRRSDRPASARPPAPIADFAARGVPEVGHRSHAPPGISGCAAADWR